MIILDVQPGSAEWHRARLGVLTASRFAGLLTPATRALSKTRYKLANKLLHEQITGTSSEEFRGNAWTEHGLEHEAEALGAFSVITGCEARPCGLIYRDETRDCAATPDWLGDGFTVEAKCPAGWTHIGYLLAGKIVPQEYVLQIQVQLWVTGFERAYFTSYAAPLAGEPWRHGASMPSLIVEVEPDPRWQDALDEHVPTFLHEMRKVRAELLEMGVHFADTQRQS